MNIKTMTTGELVTRLGSEFVEFEEKTTILKELKRRDAAKIRRQERDGAMRDCGLIKVKGAMGGTFWE